MAGWIYDFRQELDSTIWQMPPMYHRVWQYLKYTVNHSPARIPNKDGTFTDIAPGQHATSYRYLAKGVGYYEGTKWKEPNPKTIKAILDWLVTQNMITIQGNTYGTVVTVVNWAVYQSEKIKGNGKETEKKHLLDTNNKELINDELMINKITSNNKKSSHFVPPTIDEIKSYCQERKNDVDFKKFFDYFQTSNWVDSKGVKVKNWKQKIITWEGRGTVKPQQGVNTTNGSYFDEIIKRDVANRKPVEINDEELL